MDPVSVGLFIVAAVVIAFVVFEILSLRKEIDSINGMITQISATAAVPDGRVAALELENRTIKADIAEIKAIRRAGLDPARQPRPGSFRAFKNQMQGAEVEE